MFSALPLRADIARQKASLFNHLVGAQQKGFRDLQSEHFCNFLIDYEREPRRLLDSNIGRLGAAQDLVDENGYMMRHFDLISSIGKQVA